MSTYVLIHGAWHGAWCWERIIPLLEKEGHTVYAIDLPGHGSDQTPVSQVSLNNYTDKVCAIIDEAKEPVILVGHSMGGIAITQSAEYRPEKIKSLVYVTAFLLKDGEAMTDIIPGDTAALVAPNMIICEEGHSAVIKENSLKEVFYGCCDDEFVDRAKSLLTPQALSPIATKLSVKEERFGRIPKYYIECLQDQAITIQCQRQMQSATPVDQVYTLDTDHSPFYSTPNELASKLLLIEQKNYTSSKVNS